MVCGSDCLGESLRLTFAINLLSLNAVLRGTRTTVYRRDPATFDAGQLQLSKVSSYTDLGQSTTQLLMQAICLHRYSGLEADLIVAADSHYLPDDLDGTLFLGLVQ